MNDTEQRKAAKFIRPFMMGKDFIVRKPRYCLWLVHAMPGELKKLPTVMERVAKVKAFRLASTKAATRAKAETPMLFDEVKESTTDYVALPVVSSENRRYIPIDYLSREVIAGNKLFYIENATLYHFGILTSNVHMAWMRTVAGRLKSDYSYSNTVVYNNFPWPEPPTAVQIEVLAKIVAILCDELRLDIDDYHVMTHCEAAFKDGYGPGDGDPDMRWDLWFLPADPCYKLLYPGGECSCTVRKQATENKR